MKQKQLLIIILLITGMAALKVKAQNLFVWQMDGTVNPFTINSLKSFTISVGKLTLNNLSGTKDSYSLSVIKKLTFDNRKWFQNNVLEDSTNEIYIYYNASENTIYLQHVPKKHTPVIIYRINSVVKMYTYIPSGNQSIDVSGLIPGFYLLKINNQVFKFIRQ
jgi:hypothetical protein